VQGRVVVPGTALVEMAICAGDQVDCPVIDELAIEQPMVLDETGEATWVRVVVGDAEDGGRRSLDIYARPARDGAEWARHATGAVSPGGSTATGTPGDAPVAMDEPVGVVGLGVWPPVGAEVVSVGGVYE
ncbi:hypothetical protein AAHZ94_35055, partial [Streptomyces sp. HSW2009]|uniref:polyketide synthase dehydratase domain-containing protein n=1 Tax=Streptomyces sp. HSW2009 TaxID=3142890 RepID=UPI0032EBEE51